MVINVCRAAFGDSYVPVRVYITYRPDVFLFQASGTCHRMSTPYFICQTVCAI